VAGKTGTLDEAQPRGYRSSRGSWASRPANAPEVAISVLVANGEKWRIKATHVASNMLRVYFADKGKPGVTDPIERGKNARAKKKP
jgi:peptidoglycan glycosyltransferase